MKLLTFERSGKLPPTLKLLKEYKGYKLYERTDDGKHISYEICNPENVGTTWMKHFDENNFEIFIESVFIVTRVLERNLMKNIYDRREL